jgi:hypothetical protein
MQGAIMRIAAGEIKTCVAKACFSALRLKKKKFVVHGIGGLLQVRPLLGARLLRVPREEKEEIFVWRLTDWAVVVNWLLNLFEPA